MKIDWRRKLSSRKFWALIAALVVSLLTTAHVPIGEIEHVAATIAAVGSCVAYMLAEGMADGGGKK
jgi:hypothetical protein